MSLFSLRQLATRSALLLSLGLGLGACDKAVNVDPRNSYSSDNGYATKEDAAAGLLGCYDAVQGTSYDGLSYPAFADLISGNIREVGTFTTTYGQVGQNLVLPDNIELGNVWGAIYDAINRTNYLLEQSDKLTDPNFPKLTTQAEARALRAYHYMNLLAFWGGTTQGYGYSGGVGVPLRLTATTTISQTTPIARSSEADVAAAIRADLDFAIANLPLGVGTRVTRSSALALRARFELRMRNYADALAFAKQVTATSGFAGTTAVPAVLTGTTAPDALWQLFFSNTDQNFMAFYWYPSPGGRNEFDPGTTLIAAHPAGDKRLAINNNTSPAGTTLKYTHTSTRDDYFNIIRYAEVVLTIAETAAQTGDLTTALAQDNVIRTRAGLLPLVIGTAPSPAPVPAVAIYITPTAADPTGQAALITDILLQRRLELAYEGHYWFDLRRTNTIQSNLGTVPPAAANVYNQAFRNLLPIPQREVNTSNLVIAQNTGY